MDAAAGETPHRLLCVVRRNVNRHHAYSIKHLSSRQIRGFVNFAGVLIEIKIIFFSRESLVKFKSGSMFCLSTHSVLTWV